MTQEQQRVKIAEACGWKEIRAEVDWLPKELTGIFTWPHPTDAEKIKYFINRKPIPDYLNDLNAMHEAVSSTFRDASIQLEYSCALIQVIKSNSPLGKMFFSDFDLVNATAAQRAEAFLKTLNLWTEE